ncbi:hypothetical protein F2Q70_00038960 [Brassica cretica]|uniref:Uncharacterized protein n=1 Tax=Brassica cretica TaxID=69181 RepID=A0A8S9K1J0_BRACR|nr:hypothetical protein F2Q70_00038960 [Brassica cretica]
METEHAENNASEFLSAESSEYKKVVPCLSPRTPYILAPSDRAVYVLGRYLATELRRDLGRYVATELRGDLGRYVATEP